jgi:osmotically-inducible protein OsmY
MEVQTAGSPVGQETRLTSAPTNSQIEQMARGKLLRCAYADVREIECTCRDGVVTLHGSLPSFFLKQIAQSMLIHPLAGVATIDNQVRVVADGASAMD